MFKGVYKVRVRRFWGLFWSIFDSFSGGHNEIDITPGKKIKNRLKRTPKSTEPYFADTLLDS